MKAVILGAEALPILQLVNIPNGPSAIYTVFFLSNVGRILAGVLGG